MNIKEDIKIENNTEILPAWNIPAGSFYLTLQTYDILPQKGKRLGIPQWSYMTNILSTYYL